MKDRTVSLVLTSCNRFDLLEDTLRSFFSSNTYPIAQHIIIEDSPNIHKLDKVVAKFPDVEFTTLYNDPQLGQMQSIEKAYSYVTSDYIFHCEDDWEFYRKGMIEDSLAVLDSDEKVIVVWLRGFEDVSRDRVEEPMKTVKGEGGNVYFYYLKTNAKHPKNGIVWHGFTFNPGLRRTSDYLRVKPISQFDRESAVGKAYFDLGYQAAMLPDGYVRHIGYHRGIRYDKNTPEWLKQTQVELRRIKAQLLKSMGIK